MDIDEPQYNVSDLVKHAYEDQPAKMQDVFNEIMLNKVYDSIQQKKIEVAQAFFNEPVGDEEDYDDTEYEEEDTDGQDS